MEAVERFFLNHLGALQDRCLKRIQVSKAYVKFGL